MLKTSLVGVPWVPEDPLELMGLAVKIEDFLDLMKMRNLLNLFR